jgi:hypothetical protein
LRDEVDALRSTLTALQNQLTQMAQAPPPSLDPVELSGPSPAPAPAAPIGSPTVLDRRPLAVAHAGLGQVGLLRRSVEPGALGLRRHPADVPAHRVRKRGAVLHRRDAVRAEPLERSRRRHTPR